MASTAPKPTGIDENTDSSLLCHGRYGTDDMIRIWGPENTFQYSLDAQAASIGTISDMKPDIVPPDHAKELIEKANLQSIDAQRIRELEEKTGHDVIAINTAWGEVVSPEAGTHINKARTSADTTDTAKGKQLKESVEVAIDSLENLRDITLEKAMDWIDVVNMDTSHLYDALPSVAGRPFAFYGEMLHEGIKFLAHLYENSIFGKWGDATGNHHSATVLDVDGMKLQEEYCKRLGLRHMKAPAQVPGREFLSNIVYGMAVAAQTMGGLAHYIRWGRSDDVGIFRVPRGKKGSSAMPHKDAKGGNPTVEEQTESFAKYMLGASTTSLATCMFDYARDLSGSASDRLLFDDMFKWGDFVVRRLANRTHSLELIPERCNERVDRTYGTVTSQQLMTYLTDGRKTGNPMTRKDAHDLSAKLATEAYDSRTPFSDVVRGDERITSLYDEETIGKITDPFQYIGMSKEIIRDVFCSYHGKRALE